MTHRWFLPESPDLLGRLREQADITLEGMQALVAWAGGDTSAADTVRDCEHRADDAKRALWRELRDAFSPPIDAEDLYTLSADLDEILNAAKDLVRELEVLHLAPDAPIREMAQLLTDAVRELRAAFVHLGAHDDTDPTSHADAAIKAQRRIEKIYRTAMSALAGDDDLREVMQRRDAYRQVVHIGDRVHAVAERVWYSVVKEA